MSSSVALVRSQRRSAPNSVARTAPGRQLPTQRQFASFNASSAAFQSPKPTIVTFFFHHPKYTIAVPSS